MTAYLSVMWLSLSTEQHAIGLHSRNFGVVLTLRCPFAIPGFTVKQYWHARYHHDSANRWLRGLFADLFMQGAPLASGQPEP